MHSYSQWYGSLDTAPNHLSWVAKTNDAAYLCADTSGALTPMAIVEPDYPEYAMWQNVEMP